MHNSKGKKKKSIFKEAFPLTYLRDKTEFCVCVSSPDEYKLFFFFFLPRI